MTEKLRQLKKKSNMTNQQIAEKSNIPESTVARIFSGKTPNPTVTTVISMARAMGCSVADLLSEEDDESKTAENNPSDISENEKADSSAENAGAGDAEVLQADNMGFAPAERKTDETPASDFRSSEEATVHKKFYEDIISLYKTEMKKKDRWISRLFWCLAGIVAFILFVLVFDILHPSFGFVKY